MRQHTLSTGWTIACLTPSPSLLTNEPLPATVPGTVHVDLLAAGLIEDPYRDAVEADQAWMFDLDWRYATTLDPGVLDLSPVVPGERVELLFEGLDTVATVRLGGTELGRSFNMHRSYRYDVGELLDGKAKPLEVDLTSATRYASAERERLGDRPTAYSTPYNFIRKMAASFGWDWGPDLRTAGVWKPVRLQRWHTARFDRVRPLVTVADGVGRVEVRVDLTRVVDGPLELTASVLGHESRIVVPADMAEATVIVDVPDAPLWWPSGHGEQPLADLDVTLSRAGTELDHWSRRIGFRTVRLDTGTDEFGTRFTLEVNGRPMFAKGANWIPDDHFLTRITPERVRRRLDQALGANVNLIRVWGGGIYESEDFYDACDERGILVWQDFLLACATYPEEAPLWDEIEAEARENVVRLMSHPSLALYNGGNENLWGHEDWGWQERLGGLTWGDRYALELFPTIVNELDPTRPYCANSPVSPGTRPDQVHPNDPDHGTHHEWEVWNRVDYTHYRDAIPRFCSEFGFQAPPTWRTLTDWVAADDGGALTDAEDPKTQATFLVHQKAEDGNAKLDRGMSPHLGVPIDFETWHWAAQLNQAHAITHAIDHYRSWWPRTAGAIVWQLNDCWPVTSWAAIDYEERPKSLWYALRHANAPRRLVFGTRDEALTVTVINDTDEHWRGTLALRREELDGTLLAKREHPVDVQARAVVTLGIEPALAAPSDPHSEILIADLDEVTGLHTYVPDVELALDPDPVDVTVEESADGYLVVIHARTLAKDVTLCVDRIAPDARVDESMITVPAGRTAGFVVSTAASGMADQLRRAPVLRMSNDLPRRVGLSPR